jgi:hypothetical protein
VAELAVSRWRSQAARGGRARGFPAEVPSNAGRRSSRRLGGGPRAAELVESVEEFDSGRC